MRCSQHRCSLVPRARGVAASPGVGVNLGSIQVDDVLSPGGGYDLPTLGVINTGDEALRYEVSVRYRADQDEQRPGEDWFSFQPQGFRLEPGESQPVDIRLTLPTGARPGAYFAHLEAHPVADDRGAIGVAAATRLSFTVDDAGWFSAQRHRLNRWLDEYGPWTYVIPGGLLAAFTIYKLGAAYSIDIRRR